MKRKSSTYFRKSFWLVMIMGLVLCVKEPVFAVTQEELANPVRKEETHVVGGTHETTYHYVYFGYYPQKELIGNAITNEIRNAAYDSNGDAVINGRKYRRLTWEMNSQTGTINEITRENWNKYSDNGFRYFLYEPVKWQILNNDGKTLFLFSDQIIEQQSLYSWSDYEYTWESLYLRKWLNYNGTEELNLPKRYKTKGFMNFAFSKEEQDKIQTTCVVQDPDPDYPDADGNPRTNGPDTYDKIFLLNYLEITSEQYGFCCTKRKDGMMDCHTRIKDGTDYAIALGRFFKGESKNPISVYWLRTKGKRECDAIYIVSSIGGITSEGETIELINGVAPAMNVSYDLSDCIKVSFDTNGAGTIESQILLGSNYAKEPETPSKEGYVFSGWYTDQACTIPYGFNQKLTADTTLYAGWKKPDQSTQGGVTSNPETTQNKIETFAKENQISKDTLAVTDKTIMGLKNDNDIKGSSFAAIQARTGKITSKTVQLKWNRVKNADGYEIYGNKCGKKNKYKLIKRVTKGSTTSYTQKKLKKGTYYKYIVRAYKVIDGTKVTVAVSKTIHAATGGGKYGNTKSVKVNKNKTTVTLKKGKKYSIKAKEVKKSKTIKKHRAVCYESSNKKVATVSKKGVIQTKGKGSCNIYAYAQNGIYKKIKVKVK